ncbi:MAG: substrate-binding domain-containing protein [Turicibacter sp.]|nr:substrate-binding domain-containing protein [Turicibacter sp.]
MKKFLGLMTVALFAVLLLVGCGSDDNGNDVADENGYEEVDNGDEAGSDEIGEIVVVTPAAEHGWLAGVVTFAEMAGEELGFDNFRILVSSTVAEQSAQLDDLITQGVAAIVLQPHNYELEVSAQRVIDAGIPLFVFNRVVEVDYTAYVAGSNPLMGELPARRIGEGLNGEGTVVRLNNPNSGSSSQIRNDVFLEVMAAEFPNIQVIELTVQSFTAQDALVGMADILVAHPQIDAVFSTDDDSSLGILQAIREAGRTDIQFISGGGGAQVYFREIYANDDIDLFTATYSPSMMGDTIRVAYRYLRGEAIPELDENNHWIIPPTIVTRDNVEEFLNEDLPF